MKIIKKSRICDNDDDSFAADPIWVATEISGQFSRKEEKRALSRFTRELKTKEDVRYANFHPYSGKFEIMLRRPCNTKEQAKRYSDRERLKKHIETLRIKRITKEAREIGLIK